VVTKTPWRWLSPNRLCFQVALAMRILCICDLHGDANSLSGILRNAGSVDVILLGGDLTHFGTSNQAERLVAIAQGTCPQVLAVAGNCDSAAIDDRLTEIGVSLFRRGVVCDGVGFCGVSAMPTWMGNMYEFTEDEIASSLEASYQQVRGAERSVVLSHSPPRDCQLDLTHRGNHVGSTAVRQFIDAIQPAAVVCGHIHEARGIDTIGPTTVVNCGPAFRGHHAFVQLNEKVHVELRSI